MIFENKKQKGKRTLREYDGQKVKTVKVRGSAKRKNKAYFFSRFIFYFLIVFFLGTAVYLVFFSGFLAFSMIKIQGNEAVKSSDLQKIINSKLEGKYFNFLEKNNLVLLSSRGIKNELLTKYRIISQVGVKKDFPNSLEISISERKPQLILDSGGKKWVIDESGKIFDEAGENYSYLDREDLPLFFDESDKGFSLGGLAMEEKYVFFISDFRRKVEDETEIEFENEIRSSGISSGDMRMKTKEGWTILLDENLGSVKEKEMLQTILNNKIEKEKRPDLEYIDIRIPNKIFYKFKDGTSEEVAKEAADQAIQNSDTVTTAVPPSNVSKKDDTKKKK